VPPREGGPEETLGPVAAIALGWRLVETRLRIGTLVDDAQHREDLWQEPEYTPERLQLLRRWQYLARLHTQDAEALEATKTSLAQLIWPDDLPGEILALRQTWATVRHGGLTRLLRWAEIRNSWPAGVAILRRWATQHTRWYREWRGVEQRIQRGRRWLYEQQAIALCRRYRVIVLEAMDLRQMAASKTPAVAMNSAQQYRVLASLSEWCACLTRMAEKSDTTLIYCDPASSKGETGDQDEQAVEKLLRWYRSAGVTVDEGDIPGETRQKHELQATQSSCMMADHQRSDEWPHLRGSHIRHARHISDKTP
jgi:hypothetical protein